VLEILTTAGMVLRATAEKEGRRPSPGTTLVVAITGELAGAWKKTAARTNEPAATDRSAPREYFFRDIYFLLFPQKVLISNISDFASRFKPGRDQKKRLQKPIATVKKEKINRALKIL